MCVLLLSQVFIAFRQKNHQHLVYISILLMQLRVPRCYQTKWVLRHQMRYLSKMTRILVKELKLRNIPKEEVEVRWKCFCRVIPGLGSLAVEDTEGVIHGLKSERSVGLNLRIPNFSKMEGWKKASQRQEGFDNKVAGYEIKAHFYESQCKSAFWLVKFVKSGLREANQEWAKI